MRKTFCALLCSFIFISGCGNNNETENNINNKEQAIHVKDSIQNNPKEEMTNQEIAQHLANLASRVPDIKDATAVVAGPYAIVGVDIDAELDRSRVGSIKYSVAESLRHDPYGAQAIVVADPDTFTRLEELGEKIGDGTPGRAIMEELAAIVGRIMPQVPSEIQSDQDPTEENESKLTNDEEKQLDEIQRDQSNHKMNN